MVERQGDRAGRLARGVVPEDAPHHLGFRRVDAPLARDRLSVGREAADDIITEAEPAARLALLHATTLPATRLVGQVLQEEGVHRALQSDMQLRDVALRQSDDPHAGELHALEQARNVLLVTAEPVHGLGEYDIEATASCVLDQLLDARPQQRRARRSPGRCSCR